MYKKSIAWNKKEKNENKKNVTERLRRKKRSLLGEERTLVV
jgi:hypothetical protein